MGDKIHIVKSSCFLGGKSF